MAATEATLRTVRVAALTWRIVPRTDEIQDYLNSSILNFMTYVSL